MKRMMPQYLATLVVLCLTATLMLPAGAQTPVASPAATSDPFALPANLRILRIRAGNGFDYLRLDGGGLAYLNADLVDDGLSRVPVPQWLETWYTDMGVMDQYMTYVIMVPEDATTPTGVIIDIRLLTFPDDAHSAAAVPATFDVLLRQAEENPAASQGITMYPAPPDHDQAIIGVTGFDPGFNTQNGAQGEFVAPFTRFIAQEGNMVASIKVTSADEAFNDAIARELLSDQLACLTANEFCQPVPVPAVPYQPGTPVASPVAVAPHERSTLRRAA